VALTEKQKLFVAAYLAEPNATAAAKKAGYSERTAHSIGAENLNKPEIKAEIEKGLAEVKRDLGITRDRILNEYKAIAFAKVTDYVDVKVEEDEDGKTFYNVRYKDTDELTEDQKRAISSIKRDGNGIVINTHDKLKALDFLTKYMGMTEREGEENGVSIIIKGDVDGYSD
jgi:phage terminase small subunit